MKKTIFIILMLATLMLSGSYEVTAIDTIVGTEGYSDFKYEAVEVDSTLLDTLSYSIGAVSNYFDFLPVDYTNYVCHFGEYEIDFNIEDESLTIDGLLYEKPSNQESNSEIDEIIQYYKLFKQIETLDARIETLEQKIEVLEQAVENEIFEQPKHNPNIQNLPIYPKDEFWEWKQLYGMKFNMPTVDLEWERFMEWKKRQPNPEKVTIDTVYTLDEIIADSLCVFGKLEMLPPTAQGTTEYPTPYNYRDDDIDAILDELSDMWEAIDKINRRLK